MIIIASAFLILLVCFGIEYFVKIRWLKAVFHFVLITATSIVVLRFASDVGSKVERYDNASMVADTLEYFEDSARSNSLPEIRAKLSVLRQELPKAITSGEPTTPTLLKALGVGDLTNNVSISTNTAPEPKAAAH
ncbi:MAG: hypothetical protein ABSE90_11915 [Verrucomicrobiota bacterium]|jgi:hypothetical protein